MDIPPYNDPRVAHHVLVPLGESDTWAGKDPNEDKASK